MIQSLCNELICQIISYLSYKSIIHLSQTSTDLNNLCQNIPNITTHIKVHNHCITFNKYYDGKLIGTYNGIISDIKIYVAEDMNNRFRKYIYILPTNSITHSHIDSCMMCFPLNILCLYEIKDETLSLYSYDYKYIKSYHIDQKKQILTESAQNYYLVEACLKCYCARNRIQEYSII